jgi:tetrahydromethanopterin S-methyltransferase subunit E
MSRGIARASKALGTSAGAVFDLPTDLTPQSNPNVLPQQCLLGLVRLPEDHLAAVLGGRPRTAFLLAPVDKPSAVQWASPDGRMLTETTGRPLEK